MPDNEQCYFCDSTVNVLPANGDYKNLKCLACGSYKISRTLSSIFHNKNNIDTKGRSILSHYSRQKNEMGELPIFTDNLVDRIIEEHSLPKLPEQKDHLIFHIGRHSPIGGFTPFNISVLKAVIGALDNANVHFICNHLLEQHYIRHIHGDQVYFSNDQANLGLDMKGWEMFYELEKGQNIAPNLAFMAMPFGDKQLDEIYTTYFKPACKAVGFDLRRVDEKPEAGIINNKMMVDIRKSRFVIAELTDENRGVYWEAGFAEGLNRPVIYICDNAYKKKIEREGKSIHFDVRQHHTVFWSDDNLLDAARQLIITIQATIFEAKMIDVDQFTLD